MGSRLTWSSSIQCEHCTAAVVTLYCKLLYCRGDVLGTEVAEALVRLLSDESTDVQVTATAALCK